MAHQEKAWDYSLGRKRIGLFMEMRLGKTMVAIRWARGGKVLVVAPLSTIPGWEEELELEGQDPPLWLTGMSKDKKLDLALSSATKWHLTNYEALRVAPDLCSLPWSCVILDESTKIRNPQAQVTKLLTRKLGHVPRRAILTGLPTPESMLDYFEQMRFTFGSFLGHTNYWAFRQEYFTPDYMGWNWEPRDDAARKRIRDEVHKLCFFMSRKKAGVGSAKIRETRVVYLPQRVMRQYERLEKDWSIDGSMTKWRVVVDTWLARLSGGFDPEGKLVHDAKFKELMDLLTGELKREQVVVWFRFTDEMEEAGRRLLKARIPYGVINGNVPIAKRKQNCIDFRGKSIRVMLVQEKIRYGLNLASADTAIYFSNSYDFEDRSQSEDRIIHAKKSKPVLLIDLVASGTIDEDVVFAVRNKNLNARNYTTSIFQHWLERIARKYGR